MTHAKPTYLVCLNEINIELVRHYCAAGVLPNFSKILAEGHFYKTESEQKYELLEPWIQWVTVHTGLDYDEHKVFRLGDIIERPDLKQIWETLEEKGLSIGAISPFNADNRLKDAAFFVPDPWTQTHASGDLLLRKLAETVSKAVNENASGKIGFSDAITLVASILKYSSVKGYLDYFNRLLKITKPGAKAILLDQLLGDVFVANCAKSNPDFGTLFLNSGAHIQHHYYFNSSGYKGEHQNPDWYCAESEDPLQEILVVYDGLLGKLLKQNNQLIIATGLHQVPHGHMTFYWRLSNHSQFLTSIGVQNISSVVPRMSRDFLIEFDSSESCQVGKERLLDLRMQRDGSSIFSVDDRGSSLFVELTYANDINADDNLVDSTDAVVAQGFKKHIAFVAIKNGEHNGEGYVLTNIDINKPAKFPLKELRTVIADVATG